jgi:hypothetical protein
MTKVVHCKKEPYDVYIGRSTRPSGKWGNPFTHRQNGNTLAKYIVGTRDEAIEAYKNWITKGDGRYLLADLHELEGKTLGCWCCQTPSYYTEGMKMICHGEVLMELLENNNYLTFNIQ